jgi:hypothetical protein
MTLQLDGGKAILYGVIGLAVLAGGLYLFGHLERTYGFDAGQLSVNQLPADTVRINVPMLVDVPRIVEVYVTGKPVPLDSAELATLHQRIDSLRAAKDSTFSILDDLSQPFTARSEFNTANPDSSLLMHGVLTQTAFPFNKTFHSFVDIDRVISNREWLTLQRFTVKREAWWVKPGVAVGGFATGMAFANKSPLVGTGFGLATIVLCAFHWEWPL